MFILSFSISFVCLVVILFILCVIRLWDSAATHSPCGKELNPSSQEHAHFSGKMSISQGVAHRQANFILSCVSPLWDSTTAHSPSGKEFNPSPQEDGRFSGRCTLAYNFHFILRHPSLGHSNSPLTLR